MSQYDLIWSPEAQGWVRIVRGKHEPRCNERCAGDWHYFGSDQ